MWNKKKQVFIITVICICVCIVDVTAAGAGGYGDENKKVHQLLAKKNEWRSVVSTEYGEISDVEISDGISGTYYLQHINLEPNALFLPVILHADMIFYVHSGSGKVTWFEEINEEENGHKHKEKDGSQELRVQRGDIYRLKPGTIFYIQSSLDDERKKLRIYAIFTNSEGDLRESLIGPYSGIRDLILGFDKKLLQAAFQMPEEAVEEIASAKKPPQIVHALQNSSSKTFWEVEAQIMEVFLGRYNLFDVNKKKEKSTGVYNILTGDRDVENCNGWSTAVSSKQSRCLRGSNFGLFMVNLTKGAMMGPHWNPTATEIAIVLEGQGMVSVVCLGLARAECKNTRLSVGEGDAFVVPRYHPMAQMAFNNGTFVFVGFTTKDKENHPQFLAGKRSVLQTLPKQVLTVSFNVSNSTSSKLLEPQNESIILECVSCAEKEEMLLEEEIKERKKEEARKREEERKRKREEEEEKRRQEEIKKKEEQEARKREEEKRKEEERKKQEEEERKREEEEEKRRQEEMKRKEEEEARRREEEKRREEERKKQEEEKRIREEEKRREEERKRKEEEEARREEQEEKDRQEEERKREEEEAARRAEEAAAKKREEEMERKRQEEAARRAEEERKRREEEAAAREREEKKEREREEEEAAARRAEEEARKREKEKAKEEEERSRQEEEQVQQEEARRQQEASREAAAERKAKEEEQEQKRQQEESEEVKYQLGGPGDEGKIAI